MDDGTPLRVGLVGCGNVVVNDHAPVLRHLPSVQVVGVADPVPTRRQRVLEILGLPAGAGYPSHGRLLAAERLDYVLLAVPPAMRQEIVLDCARAGVHVLTEKPLATRPAAAQVMQDAMAAAGLQFGMVHNYLFYPEYRLLKDLIQGGAVGALRHVLLNFLGVPDNPGAGDYRPRWRHDPQEAGGGVLMDMIHAVYVAEYLVGASVQAVSALVDRLGAPGDPVEDLALVQLIFPACYATVQMGWGHGPGGLELSGSSGRVMVFYQDYGTGPFAALETFTLVNAEGRREMNPRQAYDGRQNLLAIHRDFGEAIRAQRPPLAPAAMGARSLEVVLAAYLSALQGAVVPLPLPPDHPVYQLGVAGLQEVEGWERSPVKARRLFNLTM